MKISVECRDNTLVPDGDLDVCGVRFSGHAAFASMYGIMTAKSKIKTSSEWDTLIQQEAH